jgi:hypothetical protein
MFRRLVNQYFKPKPGKLLKGLMLKCLPWEKDGSKLLGRDLNFRLLSGESAGVYMEAVEHWKLKLH